MPGPSKRWLLLLCASQVMTACHVVQTVVPVTEVASIQHQRASAAGLALRNLTEIDSLIRLDNAWLAAQIEDRLREQAGLSGRYEFQRLALGFTRQYVSLEGLVDISDGQGHVISAVFGGDVLLDFSGSRLDWFPRFSQLRVGSADFLFEGESYAVATPELSQELLGGMGADIADALADRNANSILLLASPLGEIEVGATLPGFADVPARRAHPLRGLFMVAGSAMLIDSAVTTIAADMTFIPDLSNCPAEVEVSRAMFASDIRNREPERVISDIEDVAEARFFYSEIRGAKQPLKIIHYWFADGLPLAVKELAVGASERWRTWSGRGSANARVGHWEVLVVEKESGCILRSKSIRRLEPETQRVPVNAAQAWQSFKALKDDFELRTAGFSIAAGKPEIGRIEIRRPFLSTVLRAALTDVSIDAQFDSSGFATLQHAAGMQPFDSGGIVCEPRDCPPASACKTGLAQCKRLRDTRDCSTCLFRNPLNNRCVSETIDPMCEASRNRQNARYETARILCIKNAEAARRECDQLKSQAVRSCELEAGLEDSLCESVKAGIKNLWPGAVLARASARASIGGALSVNFSDFRILGDLESLQLDMTLQPALRLTGEVRFRPTTNGSPLDRCIAAWQAPFSSRFMTTTRVKDLTGQLKRAEGGFAVDWSGFGVAVAVKPAPLESAFVNRPQLLASCGIGLTVQKVEQAFADAGADAEFFRGQIELQIQPLATVIRLAPVRLGSGERARSGQPVLSDSHLRYDIGN